MEPLRVLRAIQTKMRTRPREVRLTVCWVTRHFLGDPSLSAGTRYASTIISLEECCPCHTPRCAGPKRLLSDCFKEEPTRAMRHCTRYTPNGSQAQIALCVVVMQTSSMFCRAMLLPVTLSTKRKRTRTSPLKFWPSRRARTRVVMFNLTASAWA